MNKIGGRITGRDGGFFAGDKGIVLDTNTGLAWVDGPNKRMTWDEAKSWVANLTVAGGGWHMPTRKELKTLYQKGAGTENRTPLFKNNNCGVWSGETKGSSWAYFFNFCNGKTYWELCGSHRDLYSRGVTAVRSRK